MQQYTASEAAGNITSDPVYLPVSVAGNTFALRLDQVGCTLRSGWSACACSLLLSPPRLEIV